MWSGINDKFVLKLFLLMLIFCPYDMPLLVASELKHFVRSTEIMNVLVMRAAEFQWAWRTAGIL